MPHVSQVKQMIHSGTMPHDWVISNIPNQHSSLSEDQLRCHNSCVATAFKYHFPKHNRPQKHTHPNPMLLCEETVCSRAQGNNMRQCWKLRHTDARGDLSAQSKTKGALVLLITDLTVIIFSLCCSQSWLVSTQTLGASLINMRSYWWDGWM